MQAAVADVAKNTGLITATARTAGAATPLAVVCDELFGEAVELGLGSADLIAVLRALESRVNLWLAPPRRALPIWSIAWGRVGSWAYDEGCWRCFCSP